MANIGDIFGDLTFLSYVDEPYESVQARIEKNNNKNQTTESNLKKQVFGFFRCSCGRHEVKNTVNVFYSKPKCVHIRKINRKDPYYGGVQNIKSLNTKYFNLKKDFGEENIEWKSFTEFYNYFVLKLNDLKTSSEALGINKKAIVSIREGSTAANSESAIVSTETRKKDGILDIGVQIIDGQEYNTLVSISKDYNIPLSTVFRRYKSGKRGERLVKKN